MKPFDYRPAPFWFLNGRLEKEELRRQIGLMKEAGVSGFFMHPRCGLEYPSYGSEEYFRTVAFIAEEAEKAGLNAWLYDEDPFPSGAAGGRIFMENPEYIAKSLRIAKAEPDGEGRIRLCDVRGRALCALAVRAEGEKIVETRDVTGSVGVLRRTWMKTVWQSSYYVDTYGKIIYPHNRADTYFPELALDCTLLGKGWTVYLAYVVPTVAEKPFGALPDNLNPKCVKRFLELTHERYAETAGEMFGKCVPGLFTDEAVAGGYLPWTEKLPDAFFRKHGYRIEDCYFHLSATYGEFSRKVRCDYFSTVDDLLIKSYYRPVSDWCKKHGLLFTGHSLGEENPVAQAVSSGNLCRTLGYLDIPGFDVVGRLIGSRDHFALSTGAKIVSSAAAQQGKRTVLCESFACLPFNATERDLAAIAGWLFSMGINWLVPHGYHYSYDGFRKDDAGKSYFFQDRHFGGQRDFNVFAERTGKISGSSDYVCDTVLVYPTWDFRRFLPVEADRAEALRVRYTAAERFLTENHVQFEVADYDALFAARKGEGYIRVGRRKYRSAVVLGGEDAAENTARAEEFLLGAGVSVFRAGSDGSCDLKALEKAGCTRVPVFAGSAGDAGDVFTRLTRRGRDAFVFVYNSSPRPVRFYLGLTPGCFSAVTDLWTGENSALVSREGKAEISLPAYGCLSVITGLSASGAGGEYCPRKYEEEREICPSPDWNYLPPCPVRAVVSRWDVAAGGKSIKNLPFGPLRDAFGSEEKYLMEKERRPVFDTAERAASVYPSEARYAAEFELNGDDVSLLFERSTFCGEAEVYLNGIRLDLAAAERRRVYDAENRVLSLRGIAQKGTNRLLAVFSRAGEFDGVYSALYLV